ASIRILPPKLPKSQLALLPRELLPVNQQPEGTSPVSVSDLLQSGQTQMMRVDQLLSELQKRAPAMLDRLQSAINNANALAINANAMLQRFGQRGDEMTITLQRALNVASANIVDLTKQLDLSLNRNSGRIDTLMTSLNATASSLADASQQLK